MNIKGTLVAETPIYRGNARKTLFTRDGDGKKRLVSLAGEISGTAQALMDAFIGASRNGKNIGLINQLWKRLYNEEMPDNLIKAVKCNLSDDCYTSDHFFDLRMGIKLDEDRWAAEANANYKLETLLRDSVFDFQMSVNDKSLSDNGNDAKLYYVLRELMEGRFWFGAGKSKGLGRVRLQANLPIPEPESLPPKLNQNANHLRINLRFDSENPILVGWNWGKIDPLAPSFASVEAKLLIESMTAIPPEIRDRLEMTLGGPILNPENWKEKFSEYFPRMVAVWLREKSVASAEVWVLSLASVKSLSKGKHALNKNLIGKLEPLADKPFSTKEEASEVIAAAFEKKANMVKRVVKLLEKEERDSTGLNRDAWRLLVDQLGFDDNLADAVDAEIQDEMALAKVLAPACRAAERDLFQRVDHQLNMLQSDVWVDQEIENRRAHLKIKKMLLDGKIDDYKYSQSGKAPEGVSEEAWREFLKAHERVSYRHITHPVNLKKSIVNDQNQIEFLTAYRNRARQALALPEHIDFRAGGPNNREISQKYGKPYDTIFMRMLTFRPSSETPFAWEAYIPGSTLKGAFRKRASQLLKTIWGETSDTNNMLTALFGAQGRRGMIFFSDAYLVNPDDPNRSWCSVDGIRMNSETGQPIDASKRDYLMAYGKKLEFKFSLDLQDIRDRDLGAVNLLRHLIQDFKNGDIPIGGEKTNGCGWVRAEIDGVKWLTAGASSIHKSLFGAPPLEPAGLWQSLNLQGEAAAEAVVPSEGIATKGASAAPEVVVHKDGFISHRAFGGFCGRLMVEAEVLTPLAIRESGQPTATVVMDGETVNGSDFFSLSPPKNEYRDKDRIYALPSNSIKGTVRHLYTIACDDKISGKKISGLNATERLFGFVGDGPNQALMGRLSFDFGLFDNADLAWFKVPYPYGLWRYEDGAWHETSKGQAMRHMIDSRWRLFPHAPLAPIVVQCDGFAPDTVQALYFRAMMPGSRARFAIRFWNLTAEELGRLTWCVGLEAGLAHKMGGCRYIGFGSIKMTVLPESYLIDWEKRYSGRSESRWKTPFEVDASAPKRVVRHYSEIKRVLNAEHI